MKVAILSTKFFGCPPQNYGGLELVNWNLACSLAELGHKVVLYAPNESQIPPGGFLYETGPALNSVSVDWKQTEKDMWELYKDTLGEYDIILGSNWFGFEYASKAQHPEYYVCHVHHGHLGRWWFRSKPSFKLNIIAISDWMVRSYASRGITARRAYNGINLDRYPFSDSHGDRLLYVGRFTKFKGAHVALEVAEKTGLSLDLLGGATFVTGPDRKYFEEIKRRCDGERFKVYPDASHEVKVKLMQNAKAILLPSDFGEPFCLCIPEALSTGCPVICYDDGGMKEIVEDGVSGFVVPKSPVAMAEAVKKVDTIRPEDCRARAGKFSRRAMAEGYLKLYEAILAGDEW